MRHCCEFDAFDIWYLKDNESFTNRVLFIGDCPICKKHVVILNQKNIKINGFVSVKKIGDSAKKFTKEVKSEIAYTRNKLNKAMFESKPYSWRYGVNKEKTDKNGNKVEEQYAVDFYGNKELVKKKTVK